MPRGRCLLLFLALSGGQVARAQGLCAGAGCSCSSSGCSCPSGCDFTCTATEECLFEADGGVTAQCLQDSRCELSLGAGANLTCTTTDRCRGDLGAASRVFCSGPGECRLALGRGSNVECLPSTILGRCEINCAGDCLLRCSPSGGADCRLFCVDGGTPTPCGAGNFVGCETGCALLDAGTPVDAGRVDGGPQGDGGVSDAGQLDGGALDAGAGDAGPDDAGTPDGGIGAEADAGVRPGVPAYGIGCGCDAIGGGAALSWLLLLAGVMRLRPGRSSRRTPPGSGGRSRRPSRSAPGSP